LLLQRDFVFKEYNFLGIIELYYVKIINYYDKKSIEVRSDYELK